MLVGTQKLVAPERFRVNSTGFAHSSLVTMMKNTVFHHFQQCKRILKHAFAGRNTQHLLKKYLESNYFRTKTFKGNSIKYVKQ